MTALQVPAAASHSQFGGVVVPSWGWAKDKNPARPAGCRNDAKPFPCPDDEPEPDPEHDDQEDQFSGQDGLDLGKPTQMEGDGLEDEGDNHEGKPEQPDAPTQSVGQQTEPKGGVGGGVFDSHALEDTGQCVGQRRAKSKAHYQKETTPSLSLSSRGGLCTQPWPAVRSVQHGVHGVMRLFDETFHQLSIKADLISASKGS